MAMQERVERRPARRDDNWRATRNESRLRFLKRRSSVLKLLLAITAALSMAAQCSGAFVVIEGNASFGIVRPGFSVTRPFTVRNGGGADAILGDVSTRGLGLSAPFALTGGSCVTGQRLPENGTCTLMIRFSPTGEGTVSDTIQLSNRWTDLDDGLPRTAVAEIDITGSGGDGLMIADAPLYDYREWLVGQGVGHWFSISNEGAPAITLGDMSSAGLGLDSAFYVDASECNTGMVLDAYSGQCSVLVIFAPDALGPFSDTMTVGYTAVGGTEKRSLTIELRGTGAPPALVASSPGGDAFGAVPLGTSKTKRYTITNQGKVDMVFGQVADMLEPFSISGTTCTEWAIMAPGATCTVDVTFAPTALGSYDEILKFSYRRTEVFSTEQWVTLSVTGDGRE